MHMVSAKIIFGKFGVKNVLPLLPGALSEQDSLIELKKHRSSVTKIKASV